MRSPLTAVSAAASLAAGILLLMEPPPVAASPIAGATRRADREHSTDEENHDDWKYLLRHARPVISLQYGIGDPDRDGFGGDLAAVGSLGILLGHRIERRYAGEEGLLHQSTHFAHVGNFASRLASESPEASEVGTDMWRFGAGFGDGYGYRFASDRGRFVLQNSGTFGWHTLELEGSAVGVLSPAEALSLEQFTSHTRFGESWESALEVGFGSMLSLHAGYERMAVFPSFKIWYWLLSTGIDRGALAAIGFFVDGVADNSPYAAPVVRFLLQGALQYGFYELRQEEVHWPFDTEPPLAYDMFNIGLTTRF